MEWKSNRRLLIIGGPKHLSKESLGHHETTWAKSLEDAFGPISTQRPDLVIYFTKTNDQSLEEHVLTWLIEGFYGKFLLFDPMNRVKDSATLLQSQVVDDYFSGPVGHERFLTIVKSRLAQDVHFAAPRAMTTFDLFRNLFERGLNAIFFFDQDLDHCVTANLQAEQMTGLTLGELRHSSLRKLCQEDSFEEAQRIIRRAGRHYYDSRGTMIMKNAHGKNAKVSFSCGIFNFGRKNFIKIEVQGIASSSEATKPTRKEILENAHHSHA